MENDKDRKEKLVIQELKIRMQGDMEKELYEDDKMFYRFLKARNFKIENAEYMLREHLKWRKKNDIKNILNYKPPEVLKKHFVIDVIGFDKEGCLVKYNHFADTDFRGIIESCTVEDWFKCLIYFFELDVQELRNQSKKLGRTVDKVVFIENLENFSLAKATDKKVLFRMISTVHMYLDNYPEMMKAVYAINAPSYFNLFYSVFKAFLPNTVVQKFNIYSDDSWRKDLCEVIDPEVLPAFLGGKRTDPDGNPFCHTVLRHYEPVSEHYFLSKNKSSFASLPDVQTITVPRAGIHEIYLKVEKADSHLEWELKLKSGDIKFGILYQDYRGQKTEVVPLQRRNTDEYTENGVCECENTGTYIAVFDNSYSLFRSKELYFRISINDPRKISSQQTYESYVEMTI